MTEPSDVAVSVRDVSFGYGRGARVLEGCALQVRRGSVMSILGQNGSGKTTLLKLIAGALTPDSGTIVTRGIVAYVPQVMQLSFAYTVHDVVLMGRARKIGLFATPSAADDRAAADALNRVGMSSFAQRPFDALSGGERQLVSLARALATEADILVLDEPMASLDLRHQQGVLQWIRRLSRDDGLTVLFSTHQPQHADVVADDVALVFSPGRFESGAAREMLRPERLESLFGVELLRIGESAAGDGPLVPRWRL